jgi:hypothetical protein
MVMSLNLPDAIALRARIGFHKSSALHGAFNCDLRVPLMRRACIPFAAALATFPEARIASLLFVGSATGATPAAQTIGAVARNPEGFRASEFSAVGAPLHARRNVDVRPTPTTPAWNVYRGTQRQRGHAADSSFRATSASMRFEEPGLWIAFHTACRVTGGRAARAIFASDQPRALRSSLVCSGVIGVYTRNGDVNRTVNFRLTCAKYRQVYLYCQPPKLSAMTTSAKCV